MYLLCTQPLFYIGIFFTKFSETLGTGCIGSNSISCLSFSEISNDTVWIISHWYWIRMECRLFKVCNVLTREVYKWTLCKWSCFFFCFSLIYVLHDYLSMSYFIGSVGEQLSMSYLYHSWVWEFRCKNNVFTLMYHFHICTEFCRPSSYRLILCFPCRILYSFRRKLTSLEQITLDKNHEEIWKIL